MDLFGDDDDGVEEPPEDGEEGEDPREMNEIVQEDAFAVCGGRRGTWKSMIFDENLFNLIENQ